MSTVLIISLAAGVILVVGGGLMMYMANLVKSAYEIKVQLNTDLDERLTALNEELDKKSKWIKRDALEEIDKIKAAMLVENARRIDELMAPLGKHLDAIDDVLRNEHNGWVQAIEADRQAISALETRTKTLLKQMKRMDGGKGPDPMAAEDAPVAKEGGGADSAAPASAGAAPAAAGGAAAAPSAAPSAGASAAAPPAPAKDFAGSRNNGPQPVGNLLQEL